MRETSVSLPGARVEVNTIFEVAAGAAAPDEDASPIVNSRQASSAYLDVLVIAGSPPVSLCVLADERDDSTGLRHDPEPVAGNDGERDVGSAVDLDLDPRDRPVGDTSVHDPDARPLRRREHFHLQNRIARTVAGEVSRRGLGACLDQAAPPAVLGRCTTGK
jgi:hypothetical protein